MLTHVVLMRPKSGADPAAIDLARAKVSALRETIDGITGFDWGPNVNVEGLGHGYDLGFVMTFEDAAARDAYLPHPDHQAASQFVLAVADEILVFDLVS